MGIIIIHMLPRLFSCLVHGWKALVRLKCLVTSITRTIGVNVYH